jgi:hypothetical protein
LKRKDIPDLDFNKLNECKAMDEAQQQEPSFKCDYSNQSKKSKTSSEIDLEFDRKIEEAIDDEIKRDPGIVDKFKNLNEMKTYIIDK